MASAACGRPDVPVPQRTGRPTPEHRRCGKNWRKPSIAIGEKLYYREVGEGVRHLKEGRCIGQHGRTGSLLVIAADGVKRGTGVRRLADCDRWVADG